MKFIIHNGDKDSIIISGDTTQEIREKVSLEAKKRGWKIDDLWSEEINEDS